MYFNLIQKYKFNEENENETYGINESLFTYFKDGSPFLVLWIINNRVKNFVLQATTKNNIITLKKFIK